MLSLYNPSLFIALCIINPSLLPPQRCLLYSFPLLYYPPVYYPSSSWFLSLLFFSLLSLIIWLLSFIPLSAISPRLSHLHYPFLIYLYIVLFLYYHSLLLFLLSNPHRGPISLEALPLLFHTWPVVTCDKPDLSAGQCGGGDLSQNRGPLERGRALEDGSLLRERKIWIRADTLRAGRGSGRAGLLRQFFRHDKICIRSFQRLL
jgi:hypothetical protein